MYRKTYLVCALCVAMMCFVIAGCGSSNVTPQNFAKIQTDMTEDQVVEILGSPDDSKTKNMPLLGEMKISTWRSGESQIVIGFQKGKVKTRKGNFKS